ncbi:Calcineurin-like phosphoesterase [Globisporangium polare]
MRVVCLSDTHSLHERLRAGFRIPDGDVLIHAGDFTDTGGRDEVVAFNAFLGSLPHKYKIVIAGNHDITFDRAFYPQHWTRFRHRQQYDPDEVRGLLTNALYLEDQAVMVEGFKFYGSPWQPAFSTWAFNLPRGEQLLKKWQLVPSDTDVLITHGPPFGRLDEVENGNHQGCEALAREVDDRIRPQLHVFGHIHEGYGVVSNGTTMFANASACTVDYEPINPALVFTLETSKQSTGVNNGDGTTVQYADMYAQQLAKCTQKPPFVGREATDWDTFQDLPMDE